jgi:signal transduction histidine kinase
MRCEADGDHVLAHVEDTGGGIPEDRLTMIFEPFVQLGRSFVSQPEGTGLGLAISRDLARGMGGDVSVTSQVGVGSRFTVSLRRAAPSSGAGSDAPDVQR